MQQAVVVRRPLPASTRVSLHPSAHPKPPMSREHRFWRTPPRPPTSARRPTCGRGELGPRVVPASSISCAEGHAQHPTRRRRRRVAESIAARGGEPGQKPRRRPVAPTPSTQSAWSRPPQRQPCLCKTPPFGRVSAQTGFSRTPRVEVSRSPGGAEGIERVTTDGLPTSSARPVAYDTGQPDDGEGRVKTEVEASAGRTSRRRSRNRPDEPGDERTARRRAPPGQAADHARREGRRRRTGHVQSETIARHRGSRLGNRRRRCRPPRPSQSTAGRQRDARSAREKRATSSQKRRRRSRRAHAADAPRGVFGRRPGDTRPPHRRQRREHARPRRAGSVGRGPGYRTAQCECRRFGAGAAVVATEGRTTHDRPRTGGAGLVQL